MSGIALRILHRELQQRVTRRDKEERSMISGEEDMAPMVGNDA